MKVTGFNIKHFTQMNVHHFVMLNQLIKLRTDYFFVYFVFADNMFNKKRAQV